MVTQLTPREERGQTIAQHNGQVNRIDEMLYTVKSQSGNGEYTVNMIDGEWFCDCPDNKYRHIPCKHIHAVNFSLTMRNTVHRRTITPITNVTECIWCGSTHIVKDGVRKNKSGTLQVFNCKDCHKDFTFNIGFERMKHNPQAITAAMNLYFSGESLRNTMESLELIGVKVSHQTIYNWINKYVRLMKQYAEKIVPNVSGTWRADEIWIKFSGDMKYLFAMMDDETRFWIAQEVAETKEKHDARNLLKMSKELMGKKPDVFITDGLKAYHDAWKKEYFEHKTPYPQHIRHISIRGDHNNNKMERMNGEIRDREKTMRGLKKKQTVILQGYQLYHNYIRPHEALDGKTPADLCGIDIQGKNKWITLIQNASKEKAVNA